jgi:hypothetical protein
MEIAFFFFTLHMNRSFGGKHHLHHRVQKSVEPLANTLNLLARWFFARLIFYPEMEAMFSSETSFVYGLHGSISQKMATSLITTVKISNPTLHFTLTPKIKSKK